MASFEELYGDYRIVVASFTKYFLPAKGLLLKYESEQ